MVERWENRREGIEHRFVVQEREPGEGLLSVDVAVSGARVRVDVGGTSALLETEAGTSFSYAGLRAWDAQGTRLVAHMVARDGGLALVVDDATATYPVTIDPLITSLVWRTQASLNYGRDVAFADVDGNRKDDLIVGSRQTASLYRSSEVGPATTASFTAQGQGASSEFGHSVARAGDVNNDGFEDVLIFDRRHSAGVPEPRVFLYLGIGTGLAATPAWTVRTGDTSPNLNSTVIAGAGDVNNDGFDDVIIGDPDEGNGLANLYLGGAQGLATAPARVLQAPNGSQQFGITVARAGDVNNDGFDDVLIGAPTDEGRAFLYLGGSAGLAAAPAYGQRLALKISLGSDLGWLEAAMSMRMASMT